MDIFHLMSMCQFIILKTVQSETPETINFNILLGREKRIRVNLLPAETFLANQNVPVWIADPKRPTKLKRLEDVMQNLGPFTIYWDSSQCAAAVYYHKRTDFDVIVGHHRLIQRLYYNPATKKTEQTPNTVFLSPLLKHNENRLAENEDLVVIEGDRSKGIGIKSRLSYPDTVYVETLVIVNYDITEKLKFDYTEIVSYVLTQFNMIDMLYSKIRIPKIRINLAGIIIGTSRKSFSKSIRDCYSPKGRSFPTSKMDALCSLNAIIQTLKGYKKLPFYSYDIVVFITRHDLLRSVGRSSGTGNAEDGESLLWGLSLFPLSSYGYRRSPGHTGVSIVGMNNIFEVFPTAAHEMAHLLGVPHDGGPLWKEDGTCDAHLMKTDDSYCRKCLQFGGTTAENLKTFFGSRWGCVFRNEPKSLNDPQNPQLFLSEDDQCKCYGYVTAHKSSNFPFNLISSGAVNCQSRLKCADEDNRKHSTGLYMNGSPCDPEKIGSKVCWDSKCVPAVEDN